MADFILCRAILVFLHGAFAQYRDRQLILIITLPNPDTRHESLTGSTCRTDEQEQQRSTLGEQIVQSQLVPANFAQGEIGRERPDRQSFDQGSLLALKRGGLSVVLIN